MFRILKAIVFFVIFIFLFGYITMSLWNALVPDLFHGPILGYWQAMGLLLLAKIFFGGFHGGHKGCHGRHRHWSKEWDKDWKSYEGWRCWGQDWEEKIKNMTPEEREDWKRMVKSQFSSAKEKINRDIDAEEAKIS